MGSEWSQNMKMFLSYVNASLRAKAAEEMLLLWICQLLSPASCSKGP